MKKNIITLIIKMNYTKFSDEIMLKKVNSNIKTVESLIDKLSSKSIIKEQLKFSSAENLSRAELENYCSELELLSKKYKNELAEIQKLETETRIKGEELQLEEERRIKEAKQNEIIEKSIHTKVEFDRLKYRFFNLSVPNEEDDTSPAHLPPFFPTKREQFEYELKNSQFKLYKIIYKGEDMSDKEEFFQINRALSHVGMFEDDELYPYLFTCVRLLHDNDGKCLYEYYIISNLKNDLTILDCFQEFEIINLFDHDLFINMFFENKDSIFEKYVR